MNSRRNWQEEPCLIQLFNSLAKRATSRLPLTKLPRQPNPPTAPFFATFPTRKMLSSSRQTGCVIFAEDIEIKWLLTKLSKIFIFLCKISTIHLMRSCCADARNHLATITKAIRNRTCLCPVPAEVEVTERFSMPGIRSRQSILHHRTPSVSMRTLSPSGLHYRRHLVPCHKNTAPRHLVWI